VAVVLGLLQLLLEIRLVLVDLAVVEQVELTVILVEPQEPQTLVAVVEEKDQPLKIRVMVVQE
jgi:hypothetical protein